MPRETVASLTGKIAALQDQLTLSEARLAEERSNAIRARAELTEERKRNEALVQDVRRAEAERHRLQGYIDRVREEQGQGVRIEGAQPWGPGHADFDRFVHGRDYRGR